MRKFIKLNEDGVEYLRIIRNEIENNNSTVRCPEWSHFAISQDDKPRYGCEICKELFPKIDIVTTCPCYAYKNKKHLIRRLTEIINYNEEDK